MRHQYRVEYDKSGELSWQEEREIGAEIEAIVLKYFETKIPYNGDAFIQYNGFVTDFPYVFTIAANNWPQGTYPILMLKPGASLSRFKSEVDHRLEELGFSRVKFTPSSEMDLPHIDFAK